MRLKIPPAFVFLFFALLMYGLASGLSVGYFDFYGRLNFSALLLILGVVIGLISLYQFYKAKTSVDPRSPTKATKLVTGGVYRFTRNPMYLAMLLLLLALGLKLGNAFNAITAAFFVAYMNRFQIEPEEETLSDLFGKEYKTYCTAVRRWF